LLLAWQYLVLFPVLAVAACAPQLQPAGPRTGVPSLAGDMVVMADGAALPLRRWEPAGRVRAVVIALHGFNMYSGLFDGPGQAWAERGILTYAYDQRGFGAAPSRGYWPGEPTLVDDLDAVVGLVRARHPGVPVYLLGDSMGGAVAAVALAGAAPPPVDGAVLVAPAVWGRNHMNAFERGALWLFSNTVPWWTLTGEGLHITPSDNIAFLRKLARDPQIIRETRVDAILGIVDLMDRAFDETPRLSVPTLLLYGTKDEIIPADPTFDLLRALPPGSPVRAAVYRNGYHMLLHDLAAAKPIGDVAAWIADRAAPLPSGADQLAAEMIRNGAPREAAGRDGQAAAAEAR
jgi:alpha-beta hydrolase superfamily lysophospholipase